ncbi:MAG: C40 family peptidase [Chitinophagaceae bacterium]|nr:C40 family peptidase [Chitinophagaceae bacterium]MCW5905941.1 C40 family peptidase [Chitinophagaceae bacterium]
MKIQNVILVLAAIAVLTSCKSLQTLASKDVSTSASKEQLANQHKQVKFIENIEVSPGSVVTSKHNTTNTASKKSKVDKGEQTSTANTQTVTYTKPNEAISKSTIESADYLQLKYAVILDATVEKLTNIPLLQNIEKWWGTKYCLGGTTERCIDCSAFTQTIAIDVYGAELPRTSQEQYNASKKIATDDLEEGDLVFFHSGGKRKRVSHVGFYILNNKFVHASTSNGVMISDLNETYWRNRYKGAGRIKKNNHTDISKN